MSEKQFDNKLAGIASDAPKKEKKMKAIETTEVKKSNKFKLNPQFVGAIKLVLVLLVLGAMFYFGTQYQEQYHHQVTSEAKTLVSQLKIKQ